MSGGVSVIVHVHVKTGTTMSGLCGQGEGEGEEEMKGLCLGAKEGSRAGVCQEVE